MGTGLPAVDPQKGRAATMVANPVTAKPAEPQGRSFSFRLDLD